MSAVRPASPGKTRTCPHCKAVILESASVCPGCQHHLRFGGDPGQKVETRTALQVEGKIRHPPQEDPWEYTVVVYVRNERGEELARHVINVGALANSEERLVSLAVEVMPPKPVVVPAPRATAPASSPMATAKAPLVPPSPAAARPAAQSTSTTMHPKPASSSTTGTTGTTGTHTAVNPRPASPSTTGTHPAVTTGTNPAVTTGTNPAVRTQPAAQPASRPQPQQQPAQTAQPPAQPRATPTQQQPVPSQPLRPAKETLTPPKPGDPYTSTFGRGPKPR